MKMRFATVLIVGLCCFSLAAVGQDTGGMTAAAAKTSKFMNMPGLPGCMQVAVQRGDPSKESAALLLKFAAGCVVPWHWHTAGEQLMVVSGRGKAEMKDGKTLMVTNGDYAYLPAKNVHEFTAVSAVMMYDIPDAAFDIHYVDKDGKEIPPDEALKTPAKKVSGAKSSKKK